MILLSGNVKSQNTIGMIPLPSEEYSRIVFQSGSFGEWLRKLPLKASGSPVLDYRGKVFKTGADTTVAYIVDWAIKDRRLEQCMDMVVRFYAEYLWITNQRQDLRFPLPGGYWLDWYKWQSGYRPVFRGINVSLIKETRVDSSYANFNQYLNTIFNASHTQQFYHAYEPIKKQKVQIGDFIVRKGVRGHTVLIVDLARDREGNLYALIGNGDTPACQFFILNSPAGHPWIPVILEEEVLRLPLRRKMKWEGLRRFEIPAHQ